MRKKALVARVKELEDVLWEVIPGACDFCAWCGAPFGPHEADCRIAQVLYVERLAVTTPYGGTED